MRVSYDDKGNIKQEVRVEADERTIKDLKKKYNEFNSRIQKGQTFVKTCDEKLIEKSLERLEFLMHQANTVLNKIAAAGVLISVDDVMYGFEVIN